MPGDYQEGDGHEHFRSQLPPFAMACLQGDPSNLEWDSLEIHLDGCATCRQELEDLLQLLDDMYMGALAQEDPVPVPDLSYLPPWSTPTCPGDLVAVDFTLTDVERRLYRVKVTVIDQDQDPLSQDGHRVTVHYEAQSKESITDASGCASFHGIPYAALPQLLITINLRSPT
jgi:hypothetical protein